MNIVINGDTVLTVSIGAGKYAHGKIKAAVVNAGFDWEQSDVAVANWPEKGRYLQKVAGRTQINAGG